MSVRALPEGLTEERKSPTLNVGSTLHGWGPRLSDREKADGEPAFMSLFPDCG